VQYETFIGTPNAAYSGVPLLLISVYCWVLTQSRPAVRYGFVALLNALLIFTGFGLFMGVVTICVFGLALYRTLRKTNPDPAWYAISGLFFSAAALALFFVNYTFSPAVECFDWRHGTVLGYLWFIALLFSTFLGPTRPVFFSTALGSAVLAVSVFILAHQVYRLRSDGGVRNRNLVIAVLLAYVMVFSISTAAGRLCLGLPAAAQVSRYTTLMIPAFLAIYYYLLSLPANGARNLALLMFVIVLLPGSLTMPRSARRFPEGKRAWVSCFTLTGNAAYCNGTTGFPIYPNPQTTGLEQKLNFLREHHLNLFTGSETQRESHK